MGSALPRAPRPSCYFWRVTSTTFRMWVANANRTRSNTHKSPNDMPCSFRDVGRIADLVKLACVVCACENKKCPL